MKNESTSFRFKVIMIVITLALILSAFIHSSMPSYISDEESTSVLNVLQDVFYTIGFSNELTNHIVRKLAHFTEYTAIGVMLMNTAYAFNRIKPYRYYLQILFFGLFTAVIDEAIQLNVEGRSGQITDVLLDFSGVITGTILMLLVLTIYKKVKKIK